MSVVLNRPATYADLEAVHPHLVAELLGGELVTHPRPVPKHAVAALNLSSELGDAFYRGRSGPGGWIFASEPELHLGADVMVPEIAGWRRERLPQFPENAYIETPPDWVCEVISPSTESYDRGIKRGIYARAGVQHLWLLDPRAEILETFSLADAQWLLTATFSAKDAVSVAPFEAVSFPLAVLWPFGPAADAIKTDQTT